MLRNFFTALTVALTFGFVTLAQEYKGPELKPEFVCDLGQLTPENVKVKGSTQGLAIWGKYGFVLHDKGQCVIIDIKKNRFVSTFKLEGNTSHCNNASFGVEKGSRFPLLYISGCKGDHCCYVTDITLDGSRIVQKLFHLGDGYPPHDRLLHVVDMNTKTLVKTVNLNDLHHEPEGVAVKGKWLYMVMHVSRQPRDGQIYRFRIK